MNKRLVSLIIVFIFLGTSILPALGQQAYDLSLMISSNRVESDGALTIKGTATSNGNGFGGTPVALKIVSEKSNLVFVEQPITDDEGKYEVIFKLPQNFELGSYTVTARAVGVTKEADFTVIPGSTKPEEPEEPRDSGSTGTSKPKKDEKPQSGKEVGTNGGTLEIVKGKLSINIPAGAIAEKAVISAKELAEEALKQAKDGAKGQGYEVVSSVLEISIEPDKPLKKAMTLLFPLDENLLKGKDRRLLGVYKYVPSAKQWVYIGGSINKDGVMTVETNSFGTYAVLYYEKIYSDMVNHWAKDEVKVTTAKHITKGMTPDLYDPNGNVTRAQFAALLVRALNIPQQPYGGMFKDVNANQWYAPEVEAAARVGLVMGHDGSFNPNDNITREAMATMLIRALTYAKGYSEPPITTDSAAAMRKQFSDQGEISFWAVEHIDSALGSGLMTGMNSTTFGPRQTATRAQAAVTIYRLLQKLNKI